MERLLSLVIPAILFVVAVAIRLAVHIGARPGGVDTWYYLASARALRRTWRLPIRLPQYLLHEDTESYPPGFIFLLALVPERMLQRWFWLVAPFIDGMHLLFTYAITLRLTDSLLAASIAGGVHALTPKLVTETRNLNPRSLGAFLNSVATYLVLRSLDPAAAPTLLGVHPPLVIAAAIFAIAALFLTHTTSTVALVVTSGALAAVFADPWYLAFVAAGALGAILISGGFYFRVIHNHLESIRFWRGQVGLRGANPIADSPIYGRPSKAAVRRRRDAALAIGLIRILGENPFLVPLLLAATPTVFVVWWGPHIYVWAVTVLMWAIAVTVITPLKLFGEGHLYMKTSVFPTAFSLALVLGGVNAWRTLPGIIVLASFAASAVAIALFVVYVHTRTEQASSTPPDLAAIAQDLRARPGQRVLVLPFLYSDYVMYASGRSVLWGGHSGDLTKLRDLFPVIRRPLQDLIREYRIDHVLLDLRYTQPAPLRLDGMLAPVSQHGDFSLFAVDPAATSAE